MLHGQSTCGQIAKMGKPGQRRILINRELIGDELRRFAAKEHRFGADASVNDIWLAVDFADAAFEEAVVEHVHRLIGEHYSPFASVTIEKHCR